MMLLLTVKVYNTFVLVQVVTLPIVGIARTKACAPKSFWMRVFRRRSSLPLVGQVDGEGEGSDRMCNQENTYSKMQNSKPL